MNARTLSRLTYAWIAIISALLLFPRTTAGAAPEIAEGPFRPQAESFGKYDVPEWFRDAKFGIWSHWGPQSVPMEGDWYARHMYVPGHRQYEHHLKTYGHPSTNGWKDIVPLWKAEKFDPDRLMALYKKAGARYFVSMAVHHDNFDLWNSKHQRWNAVNFGPQRDIVGAWQKAARKQHLPFGVSEHLGASFWWWQVNKNSDPEGQFKGVPYDGANTQFQDLYHWKAAPDDDARWYSKDPRWHALWFKRIRDLVDSYHPDLLYTDGGVPFGNETGLGLIAHLYNSDPKRKGDKVNVVYTCKQASPEGGWVQDLERGVMSGINPHPWQTDTSIGDWYYNKNWKFRPVSWTIHMLVDIVSKNGNLLLNIVQRPDGSLDPEVEQSLKQLAAWTAVNGEGIYGTRPWLVYGEGAVRARGGHFNEDYAFTARDIRFTTRGDRTLYAFALGWPEEQKLLIRSLAQMPGTTARITDVRLLGYQGKLNWSHGTNGLSVELPSPEKWSAAFRQSGAANTAIGLRIIGRDLRGFKPELALAGANSIEPSQDGSFTLGADRAEIHGAQLRTEETNGESNLGFWDQPEDWASWGVRLGKPGRYRVTASCATVHPGAALAFEIGSTKIPFKVPQTGSWDQFQNVDAGTINLDKPGNLQASIRAADPANWRAVNVRWLKLTPIPVEPRK